MVVLSKINKPTHQPLPMASSKLIFIFITVNVLNFATTKAQHPNYLYQDCSKVNFTANSTYQLDLRTLLTSLSSKANRNIEFYNNTITGRNPLDTVYGLFMCRGDIPSQLCGQCVGNATHKLSTDPECSLSKEAVMWYEECMVRYSNRSFFSIVAEGPGFLLASRNNNTNQESFNRLLYDTINKTADEAANSPIGAKKFATKQATIPVFFHPLYTLAQCTPDLSPQDCRRCLNSLINYDLPRCCAGTEGGRVLYPSCIIRFEIYPFYRNLALAPSSKPAGLVPTANSGENKKDQSETITLIVVTIVVSIMFFSICCFWIRRRARDRYRAVLKENFGRESTALEGLQFDLATMEAATNNFSHENTIGKGGFGQVYKGILPDGRLVAIKRLSTSSRQGSIEFKNEVLLIAKLQHRNLVAFIGFCLEEEEMILIYEYVPNRSLDYFLFGTQQQQLTWPERYNIIRGTTKGILYLHEYSRLKVIHRDLKPSNILLDENMNPKISDFGMARIIDIDQDQENTNRIVGTYGYMSPEYAMLGQFSHKSDVYSFGIMVLEIITGIRNMNSFESYRGLISYVWRQWKNQASLSISDPKMEENYSHIEVRRCIQIGLLCVQENPDARPTMGTIVLYLNNYSFDLPAPKEPAFLLHGEVDPKVAQETSSSLPASSSTPFSINEMSVSQFYPR